MANERELSQFLYHLTQEIVASGDLSDSNINRICGKYLENSSYPDRDRLRRLVSELKRKLQIQFKEFARSSNNGQSTDTGQLHCSSCQQSQDHYSPYPVEKTTADKCVEKTISSRAFFPASLLLSDATQYSAPNSVQTFSAETAYSNSTCALRGSCRNSQEPQTTEHSPRSSEDSSTLIEQLLLKHAALDGDTSSEILMRMAASDRVLCESCHGKCPLHRCGQFRGGTDPPPVCSGKCDCGPMCRPPAYRRKKNCECPLKQCKHSEEDSGGTGGSGGGGFGNQGPILRQEPAESATPPVTCCGTRKRKKSQRPVSKPKSNK